MSENKKTPPQQQVIVDASIHPSLDQELQWIYQRLQHYEKSLPPPPPPSSSYPQRVDPQPIVLVSTGSFNPPHPSHILMALHAKRLIDQAATDSHEKEISGEKQEKAQEGMTTSTCVLGEEGVNVMLKKERQEEGRGNREIIKLADVHQSSCVIGCMLVPASNEYVCYAGRHKANALTSSSLPNLQLLASFEARSALLMSLAADCDKEEDNKNCKKNNNKNNIEGGSDFFCIGQGEAVREEFYDGVLMELSKAAKTWQGGVLSKVRFSYLCGGDRLFHIVRERRWAQFGLVIVHRSTIEEGEEKFQDERYWEPALKKKVTILRPLAQGQYANLSSTTLRGILVEESCNDDDDVGKKSTKGGDIQKDDAVGKDKDKEDRGEKLEKLFGCDFPLYCQLLNKLVFFPKTVK